MLYGYNIIDPMIIYDPDNDTFIEVINDDYDYKAFDVDITKTVIWR